MKKQIMLSIMAFMLASTLVLGSNVISNKGTLSNGFALLNKHTIEDSWSKFIINGYDFNNKRVNLAINFQTNGLGKGSYLYDGTLKRGLICQVHYVGNPILVTGNCVCGYPNNADYCAGFVPITFSAYPTII